MNKKEFIKRNLIKSLYLLPFALFCVFLLFSSSTTTAELMGLSIIVSFVAIILFGFFRNMKIYRVWVVFHTEYDKELMDLKECKKYTIKCSSYLWPMKYKFDAGEYSRSEWDNYDSAKFEAMKLLNYRTKIKVQIEDEVR